MATEGSERVSIQPPMGWDNLVRLGNLSTTLNFEPTALFRLTRSQILSHTGLGPPRFPIQAATRFADRPSETPGSLGSADIQASWGMDLSILGAYLVPHYPNI